jgi:hypothetical protein
MAERGIKGSNGKKTKGERLVFLQVWPLASSCPGHGIHSCL